MVKLKQYTSNQLVEISHELKNLKAAIIPTDTIFGLISLMDETIYKIKSRDKSKKIITFISDIDQIINFPNHYKQIIKEFWPGQLTIIFNKKAYRTPNSKAIINIINIVGPVFCSSANISNKNTINSFNEAEKEFKKHIHELIFIHDNIQQSNLASTIIDIDEFLLLRAGNIDGESILKKLKSIGEKYV